MLRALYALSYLYCTVASTASSFLKDLQGKVASKRPGKVRRKSGISYANLSETVRFIDSWQLRSTVRPVLRRALDSADRAALVSPVQALSKCFDALEGRRRRSCRREPLQICKQRDVDQLRADSTAIRAELQACLRAGTTAEKSSRSPADGDTGPFSLWTQPR